MFIVLWKGSCGALRNHQSRRVCCRKWWTAWRTHRRRTGLSIRRRASQRRRPVEKPLRASAPRSGSPSDTCRTGGRDSRRSFGRIARASRRTRLEVRDSPTRRFTPRTPAVRALCASVECCRRTRGSPIHNWASYSRWLERQPELLEQSVKRPVLKLSAGMKMVETPGLKCSDSQQLNKNYLNNLFKYSYNILFK